jgi:cell division protein FtsL
MRPTPRHRGYVLLIALVLVALAALAVAGASRTSLRQARAAIEAQRQLQRRWGTLSIQHTLLPQAARMLSAEEQRRQSTMASCRVELRLGEINFRLIICDEQAKLNVGQLTAERGRPAAEIALRQLLGASIASLKVKLRPAIGEGVATFGSYADVLDGLGPRALLGTSTASSAASAASAPAELITCWGDGRVSARRAGRQVLRAVLSPPIDIGRIDRLIALSRQSPRLSLGQVLDQLDLTREQRALAESILVEGSTCQALWIIATEGQSERYRLAVAPAGAGGPLVFEW